MAKLFNTKFELIALRSMCSRDTTVSGHLISHLDDSFFYNDESIEVFNYLKASFNKSGSVPEFKIVSQDIQISESARELLKEADTSVRGFPQAQHLVKVLSKLRRTRMFYLVARSILEELEQPRVDIDDLTEKVARKMSKIHASRMGEADIIHLGADSNAFDMIREQLYEDQSGSVVPTGFQTWDGVNGGFFRGSLVVIGGASGAGKSILANQLSINQATLGFKATTIPLEMTANEQMSRTMSSVSGMDSIDIILQRLATGEKDLVWKRMKRLNRKITASGGKYTIFKPREDMTMEELAAATHNLNSDILYLDYISLLKGVGGDDAWQKLGEVARFGKVYAEMHNRVVVLLAQVSEEGKIRYSQAIKEHASVAWTFVATAESRERGYLNIQTIKSRNQVRKDFTLKIEYRLTKVSDLDPKEIEKIEQEQEQKKNAPKKNRAAAQADQQSDFKKTSKVEDDSDLLPDLEN